MKKLWGAMSSAAPASRHEGLGLVQPACTALEPLQAGSYWPQSWLLVASIHDWVRPGLVLFLLD